MGDLSEHFSKRDFVCRCNHCKGSFRMSLTLIGILEHIRCHFNKRVDIVNAYRCPDLMEEKGGIKKSYHARGQAADIVVRDIPLEDVFLFAETISQVNGIGLYPLEKHVHIDIRDLEKAEKWVYESDYIELTDALRKKYNLVPKQETVADTPEP